MIANLAATCEDNDGPNEGSLDPNQVLRWLQVVDNHIDKNSIEIMKLGLQTELTQSDMEGEKCPFGLYHKLGRKYTNSKVPLSIFIYALEKLGHRRHGLRAVDKLQDFGIKKPK